MIEENGVTRLAVFYAYDNETVELYSHALNYSIILDSIENKLRSDFKYDDKLTSETIIYIEKLRAFISELKSENHVPLY